MARPWLTRSPEPEAADDTPSLERLGAFSDAVVAIAITLIVLPLVDQAMEAESAQEFFSNNVAGLGSAALSFVIIAVFWRGHHRVLARASGAPAAVVKLEFVWLAAIVVLPVATALEFGDAEGSGLAAASYAGALLVASVAVRLQHELLVRGGFVSAPSRSLFDRWLGSILIAVALVLMLLIPAGGAYWLLVLLVEPLLRRGLGR